MRKKKGLRLSNIPEQSDKRTTQVSLAIETDNLELYRRAAYDVGLSAVSTVIRECIELGFPLFCNKHGVMPSHPPVKELTEEEEAQRKELLEKRLRNLKYYKKVETKGEEGT